MLPSAFLKKLFKWLQACTTCWVMYLPQRTPTASINPYPQEDVELAAQQQAPNSIEQTQPQIAQDSMLNSSSSLNHREEAGQLLRFGAKILIPSQMAFILALLSVCFVAKLPAAWLDFPLIAELCLLTLALVLSFYVVVFAPYLGIRIDDARRNRIIIISAVLTVFALVTTVGAGASLRIMLRRPQGH